LAKVRSTSAEGPATGQILFFSLGAKRAFVLASITSGIAVFALRTVDGRLYLIFQICFIAASIFANAKNTWRAFVCFVP
jgi:hypothetical protein